MTRLGHAGKQRNQKIKTKTTDCSMFTKEDSKRKHNCREKKNKTRRDWKIA
jgi:hypothetical protein